MSVQEVPQHSEEPEQSSERGFIDSHEMDNFSETGISSTQADNDDDQQDMYRGAEDMVSYAVASAPHEVRERSSEERDVSSDRRATEKESITEVPVLGYPLLQDWDHRLLYVIYWRDVKVSAQIFVIGLVVLFALMHYNVLHVSCLAIMSVLLVAFVWRVSIMVYQALKKIPIMNPMQPYLDQEIEIPKEEIVRLTKKTLSCLLCLAKHLRRLLFIDDIVESLKFAVKVWLLSYVGAFFSGLTLVTIGFLLIFSVPALYEKNQHQVDTQVAKIRKQVNDVLDKLQKRFPVLGKLKKQ